MDTLRAKEACCFVLYVMSVDPPLAGKNVRAGEAYGATMSCQIVNQYVSSGCMEIFKIISTSIFFFFPFASGNVIS